MTPISGTQKLRLGCSGLLISTPERPGRTLPVQAPFAPGFFDASTGRPGLFRCKDRRNSAVGLCRNSPVPLTCPPVAWPAARARRSRPLLSTSLLQTPTVTTSRVAQRTGAVRCPAEEPYGTKWCGAVCSGAEPCGTKRCGAGPCGVERTVRFRPVRSRSSS